MELMGRIGSNRFLTSSPLDLASELAELTGNKCTAAVVYPYDPWTEIGPFWGVSSRIAMAGPWVVGALLQAAGFETRVVQQVWNRNFRPSWARLRDRPLDLFAISAMQIHAEKARELIADANSMGGDRPFIVCGGPKYIYQPQDAWRGESAYWPDVVVTGEAHVLLTLLGRMFLYKHRGESLAAAFDRMRCDGEFQDIPGLVFRAPEKTLELINTGIAQLSPNLEDRPLMVQGLSLYESPGKHKGLSLNALPLIRLKDYVEGVAVPGFTEGCTRTCGFCPIPGRMQKSYRVTSEEFVAEDLIRVFKDAGISRFFAGDDSHFNSSFCERFWTLMSEIKLNGKHLQGQIHIGTEGVLEDVAKRIGILPQAAQGGLAGVWFGVETFNYIDLDKGQNPVNAELVFQTMRALGIGPMAMTILFPAQGWRGNAERPFGVRETVDLLDSLGASSMQMTHITPSAGSKLYDEYFQNGEVLSRVGNITVGDRDFDGNRVILDFSRGKHPREIFKRQLIILGAYWRFYSPGKIIRSLEKCDQEPSDTNRRDVKFRAIGFLQTLVTTVRLVPWLWSLWRGPWERHNSLPELQIGMRNTLDPLVRLRVGHSQA